MAMTETRATATASHFHGHPDPASSGVQPMKMRKFLVMLLRRVALQVVARWLILKTLGEAKRNRGR